MTVSTTLARARSRQEGLGLSAAILARLVNISPAQLGNGFRGVTSLGAVKDAELAAITLALVELADAIAPFELPGDVDNLRRLIDTMNERHITAENVRAKILELFGEQQ